MAETDMKPLSELDLYNNLMDENSLLPMTVKPDGSNITRRVYFNALKTLIAGYDLVGTLTAGSTSITLSSTGTTYNEQTAYAVGARVTYTDPNVQGAEAKNYICTHACTAGEWGTNAPNFVEYPLLDSNSTIMIFTKAGDAPYTLAANIPASVSNNAVTLTFTEQLTDISVKVRVL